MRVVAVIPAYNEASRIGLAIRDALAYVDAVVVVDDCSQDHTFAVAQAEGAIVLRHVVNRGQGAALQTATDYALRFLGPDAIVHFDADGQMQAKEIVQLLEPIAEGRADIVLGSRFLGVEAENMPALRRLLLRAGVVFTVVLSGIKVTDS
ncbi:MAG TPA: glycosyltransferase family 2 protein, partial [bacterium]|nr:glycosyltransferase family 2 protein [bacterium]